MKCSAGFQLWYFFLAYLVPVLANDVSDSDTDHDDNDVSSGNLMAFSSFLVLQIQMNYNTKGMGVLNCRHVGGKNKRNLFP